MIDLPITEAHIRSTLTAYLDEHPEENPDLASVIRLLDAGANLASRSEFRGHATAGAILAGADGRILHIHHLATGMWLLPGGHLEPEDNSLLQAAGRELTEETGIPAHVIAPHGRDPLHIDVHPIDANPLKDEPAHQHFDFRFLFRTNAEIGELQTEEVSDAAWRETDSLNDEHLRRRIIQALR
ncbi:NUDIX hydrolase [Streptomyces lydicus]|uniref:NUDIX hydrolase n=1 Tax=Streptomyces lydicus TaxID=47763 RepID=UPI0036F5A262